MNDANTVLVVGATGSLGGQVAEHLVAKGKNVRALVRPGSDASKLETLGAEIMRGDMLDVDSLVAAMTGAQAVVSTAAGYTRRADDDTDTVGQANLAKAAARAGVSRFVLTSILTCDQTPQVPHFWHKKLAEDALEENGVPFVALRPGAFLDQVTRMTGDMSSKEPLCGSESLMCRSHSFSPAISRRISPTQWMRMWPMGSASTSAGIGLSAPTRLPPSRPR